jgi:integrase
MAKLTDAAVRNTKPRSDRYEISEASGLALRVAPKGTKSWGWRYRFEGKQKRLTLGTYPQMTLSQARAALALAQDKLARQIDPADDRPAHDTVADLVELYRKRHLPKLRSAEHQDRRLRVDILPVIGSLKLTDVTRRRLSDLVHQKAVTAPVSANRLRSLIVHLFKCGVDWGLIETSPAASIPPVVQERSRETTLTDDQIAACWHEAGKIGDVRIRSIIQLLFLTGQRVSEVCGISRGELDPDMARWTLPADRAKNGRAHRLPLSRQAVSILRAAEAESPTEYLFPAVSKRQPYVHQHSIGQAWRRICRKAGIEGVNPHDVRRTVATGMARLGVQPHVIEAVLNHVSGHRAGVAGVYQRYDYADEMLQALNLWANHVECLVASIE